MRKQNGFYQMLSLIILIASLLACQPDRQQSQQTRTASETLPEPRESAAHLLGHAVKLQEPAAIVASNPEVFELFRLPNAPAVLILDFSALRQQADMLNRLAVFHEIAGFTHREVLSAQAIKTQLHQVDRSWETLYYGHDYSALSLAQFFNALSAQQLQPNASEQFLLQLILREGLIQRVGEQYQPAQPLQALISISENSEWKSDQRSDEIRRYLLAHEIRHGLYFTDPVYRKACQDFWNGLAVSQKTAFRNSLAQVHYDAQIEDLMINETQAFLLSNSNGFENISLSLQELLQLKKQLILQLPPESVPLVLEMES